MRESILERNPTVVIYVGNLSPEKLLGLFMKEFILERSLIVVRFVGNLLQKKEI